MQRWIPQKRIAAVTAWATIFAVTFWFYLNCPPHDLNLVEVEVVIAVQKLVMFLSAGASIGGIFGNFALGSGIGLAVFAVQATFQFVLF